MQNLSAHVISGIHAAVAFLRWNAPAVKQSIHELWRDPIHWITLAGERSFQGYINQSETRWCAGSQGCGYCLSEFMTGSSTFI